MREEIHRVWATWNNGVKARKWFVSRHIGRETEYLRSPTGRMRRFATQASAELAAKATGEAYFALWRGIVNPTKGAP